MCSRAFRHLKLAHERLLETHAKGEELPPTALMGYLEQHPELAALQRSKGGEGFVVDWAWTVERDEVSDAVGRAQDSLFRLAEEMCRGEALGLRVFPAVGAAVLFEAATTNRAGTLVPDWRLWHAGCSPLESRGRRWTAQVYFEEANLRTAEDRCSAESGKGRQRGRCVAQE